MSDMAGQKFVVTLPEALAASMVSDGVAKPRLKVRGPLLNDSVAVVVDVVNTGSAAVTVGLGVAAARRFIVALVQRLRVGRHGDSVQLVVRRSGVSRTLDVTIEDEDAADEILEFLISSLPTLGAPGGSNS